MLSFLSVCESINIDRQWHVFFLLVCSWKIFSDLTKKQTFIVTRSNCTCTCWLGISSRPQKQVVDLMRNSVWMGEINFRILDATNSWPPCGCLLASLPFPYTSPRRRWKRNPIFFRKLGFAMLGKRRFYLPCDIRHVKFVSAQGPCPFLSLVITCFHKKIFADLLWIKKYDC